MILVQCDNCGRQAEGTLVDFVPPSMALPSPPQHVIGPKGWVEHVRCAECRQAVEEATEDALVKQLTKKGGFKGKVVMSNAAES